MKIFPFLLSLWITSAFAQDDTSWEVNHYEQTRTFVKDGYTYQGYTYQCDLNDRIFMSYVSLFVCLFMVCGVHALTGRL